MTISSEDIRDLPIGELGRRLVAEREAETLEKERRAHRERRARLYAEEQAPIVTKAMPQTAAATPSRARAEFATDCARAIEQAGGSAQDGEKAFREILGSDKTYRDYQLTIAISRSMGALIGTQRKEIDAELAKLRDEVAGLRTELDGLRALRRVA